MDCFLEQILEEYRSTLKIPKVENIEKFQNFPSEILYKITDQDCEQMIKLCESNSNICTNQKIKELYQLYFNKTKINVTLKEFSEKCLEAKILQQLTQKVKLFLKETGLIDPLGLIWQETNEEDFNTRTGSSRVYDDSLLLNNNIIRENLPTIGFIYTLKDIHTLSDNKPILQSTVVRSVDRFFKPLGDILHICKGVIAGGFLIYMHDCTGFGLKWNTFLESDIFVHDFAIKPYNLASKYDKSPKNNGIVTLSREHGDDDFLQILKRTNVVKSEERYFKVHQNKHADEKDSKDKAERHGGIGYSWEEIPAEDLFVDVTDNDDFSIRHSQDGVHTLEKQFIPLKNIVHKKNNVYLTPNEHTPTIFEEEYLKTCNPPHRYIYRNRLKNIDIDIYVTKEQAQIFVLQFCKLHRISHITLKFIYSNLENNPQKIKYHFELLCDIYNANNGIKRVAIDLVIVENPETVTSHFDFTFCQIGFHWKNGSYESFATKDAIHDIRRRVGRITGNFIKEFEDGNKVTHNRMHKYMARGYKMDLSNIKSLKALNYDKFIESRSNISPELKSLRTFVSPFFNNRFGALNNQQKMLFFLSNYDETKLGETRTAFGQYSNQYLNI